VPYRQIRSPKRANHFSAALLPIISPRLPDSEAHPTFTHPRPRPFLPTLLRIYPQPTPDSLPSTASTTLAVVLPFSNDFRDRCSTVRPSVQLPVPCVESFCPKTPSAIEQTRVARPLRPYLVFWVHRYDDSPLTDDYKGPSIVLYSADQPCNTAT
jgi:hypothetical protein